MKKILLSLAVLATLLAVRYEVKAQKIERDSLFFTGAVMDQKELTPLPYAHFRINDKRGGTANEYGRFSFWVNAGDTIRYSHVGYKEVKLVISDSLNQERYLFGVFMAKDTVALQEVLILPRFGNFKEAFLHAKVNTPEYVRAKNNVNSATYEALTTAPKTMDAKANTDMIIKQHQIEVEYKTMIPNEMVAGVSTTRLVPEIKRMKRKHHMKIPDNLITDQEIRILKSMYEEQVKKEK